MIRSGTPCWPHQPRLPSRVLLAGHLDTVPAAGNLPSRIDGGRLYGCGTSDMKSGDAVFLHLAATVTEPAHDLTPGVLRLRGDQAAANGLGRIERDLPTGWPPTSRCSASRPAG